MPAENLDQVWNFWVSTVALLTLSVTIIFIVIIALKKSAISKIKERGYLNTINLIEERLSQNWIKYDKFVRENDTNFSDIELVELLLSLNPTVDKINGQADELIKKYGNLRGVIDSLVGKTGSLDGVDKKHSFMMHMFKIISERYLSQGLVSLPIGDNPKAIYDYLYTTMRGLEYEQFKVICLDYQNRITNIENISNGTSTEAVVYLKELMRHALAQNAVGIILVHNHISGNTKPSDADLDITKKVFESCKLLEITLLDHIIIGDNKYFSFAEAGLVTSDRIKLV